MTKLFCIPLMLCVAVVGCSRVGGGYAVPTGSAGSDSTAEPGAATFKTILAFDETNGASPQAPLVTIGDELYGTTWDGGKAGCGIAFALSDGHERIVYTFGTNGCNPLGLTPAKTAFYGIAYGGGADHDGSVFAIKTTGQLVWSFSFDGSNGANPEGRMVPFNDHLYGVTSYGGNACGGDGCGTVFSVTTSGKLATLYDFRGEEHGEYDGTTPAAGMIVVKGTLYGTTSFGGDYDGGTLFSVSTAGKEHVVYSFGEANTDAIRPESPLIRIGDDFYGTSLYGGKYGDGTVYSVSTGGNATVLHSFGAGSDGQFPYAGLVDVNGTLYGTTEGGGSSTNCTDGCGTVFALSTSGSDERLLHSFSGKDGEYPKAGLLYHQGRFYGTTTAGGSNNAGTVFTLTP